MSTKRGHRRAIAKFLAVLAAVLALLLPSEPAQGSTIVIEHSGNADPTTEGWDDPGVGSAVTAGPVTNDFGLDAWFVNDASTAPGSGARVYLFMPPADVVSEALTSGWVLTARLRVVNISDLPDRALFVEFIDGTTRWRMDFGSQADGDPIVLLQTGVSGGGTIRVCCSPWRVVAVATISTSFGTTR